MNDVWDQMKDGNDKHVRDSIDLTDGYPVYVAISLRIVAHDRDMVEDQLWREDQ